MRCRKRLKWEEVERLTTSASVSASLARMRALTSPVWCTPLSHSSATTASCASWLSMLTLLAASTTRARVCRAWANSCSQNTRAAQQRGTRHSMEQVENTAAYLTVLPRLARVPFCFRGVPGGQGSKGGQRLVHVQCVWSVSCVVCVHVRDEFVSAECL
jgi:hypothetical protein